MTDDSCTDEECAIEFTVNLNRKPIDYQFQTWSPSASHIPNHSPSWSAPREKGFPSLRLWSLSRPKLYSLVNNGMKESREMVVDWSHEDVEVLHLFGDHCFTGEYRFDIHTNPRFGNALVHAKLYVLAEYNQTDTLKARALHLVDMELETMSPEFESPLHFIELAEYVFGSTVDAPGELDALRSLILDRCHDAYNELMQEAAFFTLLENADFAFALLCKIRPPIDPGELSWSEGTEGGSDTDSDSDTEYKREDLGIDEQEVTALLKKASLDYVYPYGALDGALAVDVIIWKMWALIGVKQRSSVW